MRSPGYFLFSCGYSLGSERRVFDSSRSLPKVYSLPRINLHSGNSVFRFSLLVWKEEILKGLSELPELKVNLKK